MEPDRAAAGQFPLQDDTIVRMHSLRSMIFRNGRAGPRVWLTIVVTAAAVVGGCGGQSPARISGAEMKVGFIKTLAGGGAVDALGDGGPATRAYVCEPADVAVSDGNVYIASFGAFGCPGSPSGNRIRRVDSKGVITTVAGNGMHGFSGDGGPATSAALADPISIALDSAANLYISDEGNKRIRKVDRKGIITTFAGTGTAGFSGDGGPASKANLNDPNGIAFDAHGNLYIVDGPRIRRIDRSGTITTVAGKGTSGHSPDGTPAQRARLDGPIDVGFDADGELLILETDGCRLRKIDKRGLLETVAGSECGYGGDGGPAKRAKTSDSAAITVDRQTGDIFIADHHNDRIRRIDRNGIITTAVGNGTRGSSGDGGPAKRASIDQPFGLTVENGVLYVTDTFNSRVRIVRLA